MARYSLIADIFCSPVQPRRGVTEVTDNNKPLQHRDQRIQHLVGMLVDDGRILAMASMDAGAPPAKTMLQLITGKCLSRCVSLAAELAIADMLTDGPKSVVTLAQATGTCPDPLYRVLRTLAAVGVFDELPDRHFRNSPLSATL